MRFIKGEAAKSEWMNGSGNSKKNGKQWHLHDDDNDASMKSASANDDKQ